MLFFSSGLNSNQTIWDEVEELKATLQIRILVSDLSEQFDGFYNKRLASKKVCFRNIVSFRQNYWTGNDSLDHRNTSLVLAGHEFALHDTMWHDQIHPTSRDGQYSRFPPMIVMRWQAGDHIDMRYVGMIL